MERRPPQRSRVFPEARKFVKGLLGLSRQAGPEVVTVSTHRQLGRKFCCAEKGLANLAQGAGHKAGGVHIARKGCFPGLGFV